MNDSRMNLINSLYPLNNDVIILLAYIISEQENSSQPRRLSGLRWSQWRKAIL